MVKTLLDGFPDEPWRDEGAQEIDAIIKDVENQLRSTTQSLGKHGVSGALFAEDRFIFEPEVFKNDPYNKINRLHLN